MKRKFLSILLLISTIVSFCCACNKGIGQSETDKNQTMETGSLQGEPIIITLNTMCDNSGTGNTQILAEKGKKVQLPIPERESYKFKGWYKDPELSEKFDENTIIEESMELFAGWDFHIDIMDLLKDPVTVQFITNGGKLSKYEFLGFATEKGKSPAMPVPEKENYNFEGWYLDYECTKKFNEGALNENIRLFAKWKSKYHIEGMTLPVISLKTNDGNDITSRDEYKGCSVSVLDSDKYNFNNAKATIKGRGNSTWTQFEKKSFRIKFIEKTNLLGMGSAKDFLLISNAFDQSMMRNYTAYTFAGLYGDPYTTQCKFVHVYVNDDYRGVYLLTEQTERSKNRVDIDDGTSLELDVGYLAEFAGEQDVTGKKSFTLVPVMVNGKKIFWRERQIGKIMSPSSSVCTDAQCEYFSNYVNNVNKAILRGNFNEFLSLCDVDSFVDNFIMNEILYSSDYGYSFFIYKPAKGKLCLGPLWDYDQSAGNSAHGGVEYDKWETASEHLWFKMLRQNPSFMKLVRERYIEKYDVIHSLPSLIKDTYNEIVSDIALNYNRWNEIGVPHWRSIKEQVEFKTQKEHVDFYINWINNRLSWLEAKEQLNISKEDIK